MNRKKYGLMGGTFDPIHLGHLLAAETVREDFKLDRVIFIPCGIPPHKKNYRVTQAKIRYHMVKLAISGHPRFMISDYEVKRQRPSYTVDTLTYFTGCYPEIDFYFITGADAIFELVTWKEINRLFSLCSFIGVTRHGYDLKKALNEHTILRNHQDRLFFSEIPKVEISSTYIRQRVRDNKSIKYLVPEKVESYIRKHGLYVLSD